MKIQKKVDPLCQDEYGITPIHTALLKGHLSILRLLVEAYHCDPTMYQNIEWRNTIKQGSEKESHPHHFLSVFLENVASTPTTCFVTRMFLLASVHVM